MQFSVSLDRERGSGFKMKTIDSYKNPYRKETNLDNIVDQLCTKLQDIKDQESAHGMPTCTLEHTEAVRRYYEAFPALKKGQESLQYYMPPPEWCRKPDSQHAMQSDLAIKDWNKKKLPTNKERRSFYHGQRRNRKRTNSHGKSFESKEILPEWVTHEGVWDMETQDPVKEFIRAIALDEGYGTCENTVTDELHQMSLGKMRDNIVPDWDDSLNLDSQWVISDDLKPKVLTPMEEELYAKFEAKFDRSIEALWSKDQNTPDDEYQDLPIDFQDLLSSPSDHMFADPSVEKCSLISLTESIWSNDGFPVIESPTKLAEALHDRFKPLNLVDTPIGRPQKVDSCALYSEEVKDDSAIAITKLSLTAINHSRERSGFVEVPPRRQKVERVDIDIVKESKVEEPKRCESRDREDLLTSSRTHFRPIRREAADAVRYEDGDAFDIRGDLNAVEFTRSASGGQFLATTLERYLEYRADRGINYSRLKLTAAQRCPDLEDPAFVLRFPLRQRDVAIQTEQIVVWNSCECGRGAKKMRPAMESIWSESGGCEGCGPPPVSPTAPPPEELSREWEELLADISAAHAEYSGTSEQAVEEVVSRADRKRRHSAALRTPQCSHPHARFLQCCALLDRPLTR